MLHSKMISTYSLLRYLTKTKNVDSTYSSHLIEITSWYGNSVVHRIFHNMYFSTGLQTIINWTLVPIRTWPEKTFDVYTCLKQIQDSYFIPILQFHFLCTIMPKKNTAQLIVFRNALLDTWAPVETDTFFSSGINRTNSLSLQRVGAFLLHNIS